MIFSSIFKANAQNDQGIIVLPVAEYKEAISGKQVQLADVRTSQEFKSGHIPNAVNIDFFQPVTFAEKFSNFNKKEPVYIYCRSGNRSLTAARKLLQMGFTKVYDLEGGFMNWR
jgi:rhodanese-related sulfurtransferase